MSTLERLENIEVGQLEAVLEVINKEVVISNGRIVEVCGK